MEHEFQTEGLELGLMRAKSYFSPIYKYADLLTGFDYLRFLQDLEQHFMENPDRVRAELREIAGTIFNQKSLLVGICSEEADLQEARHHIVEFVSTLPQDFHPNGQYVRTGEKRNEAVPISGDVNFVIMGGNLLEASDKETDSAAWLLPYVLNRLYLYPQLRQKRGAYGAFVHTDSSGNFLFYSYRDPNIAETIEVFRGAEIF
ncbi:MAG: hypothetical protein Q4A41_06045 [Bacillota bacterium]|nr:hypothetical protein [Bacillota bacterium]